MSQGRSLWALRERLIGDSPRSALRILARCMLAMAPAVVLSLVLPPRLMAIVVLVVSWVVVYQLTEGFQEELFTLPLRPTHLQIAAPLTVIFMGWLYLLLKLGRGQQLTATVAPMLILLGTAIAPLYRRLKSRQAKRRVPYRWAYGIAASVVFVVEVIVMRNLR
jgi:hypothetical protein